MEKKPSYLLLGILSSFLICILLIALSFTILYQSSQRYRVAQALLDTLQESLEQAESVEKSTEETDTDTTVDSVHDVFYLREANGRIGIFTEQGYPIRMLTVDVATLPEVDRLALSDGICVTSLSELIALIEDYES